MEIAIKAPQVYDCEVKEIFSGDDLIVLIDLGVEGLWKKQRVRLSGVDTPNAVSAGHDTPAGTIRRDIRMLTRNRKGKLTVVSKNTNSWVVVLLVDTMSEGPVNINERLIQQGFAFTKTK